MVSLYGILFTIGIILILLSFFIKNDEKENNSDFDIQRLELMASSNENLNSSINESKKMIKNINELSEYIFAEIEKKHKELVFLYDLIDEKEKKLKNDESFTNKGEKKVKTQIDQEIDKIGITSTKSKDDVILELFKKGYELSDIAKKLDVGIGEVKLIVNLAKAKMR